MDGRIFTSDFLFLGIWLKKILRNDCISGVGRCIINKEWLKSVG